jgi:hypothetical protein
VPFFIDSVINENCGFLPPHLFIVIPTVPLGRSPSGRGCALRAAAEWRDRVAVAMDSFAAIPPLREPQVRLASVGMTLKFCG